MSFMDNVLRKKRLSPGSTFKLTQEGTQKLVDGRKDAAGRILCALQARGTSDINEISMTSGLPRGQVEAILPSLIKGGYVSNINAGGLDD